MIDDEITRLEEMDTRLMVLREEYDEVVDDLGAMKREVKKLVQFVEEMVWDWECWKARVKEQVSRLNRLL